MSRDFPPPEEEAIWQAQLDEYESNLLNQAREFFARKYAANKQTEKGDKAKKKQIKTTKSRQSTDK